MAKFIEDRRRTGKLRFVGKGRPLKRGGEVSDSTINKALNVWHAAHTKARDEWELTVRPIDWAKHGMPEPDPRIGAKSREEIMTLLRSLPTEPRLAAWFFAGGGHGQLYRCSPVRCRRLLIASFTSGRWSKRIGRIVLRSSQTCLLRPKLRKQSSMPQYVMSDRCTHRRSSRHSRRAIVSTLEKHKARENSIYFKGVLAETRGFEPPVAITDHNDLANRRP